MNRWTAAGFDSAGHGAGRGWPMWLAMVAVCLGLASCGGSPGGGKGAEALGLVKVTVTDTFGAPVAGATVQGPTGTSITDAQGVALVVTNAPNSTATVTVSRDTFVDKSITATSTAGQTNAIAVTIDRATAAAGGSLTSRSGVLPTVNDTAQQVTFETEVIVVDGNSQPIGNLTQANFVLQPCTPDPTSALADCVSGAGAGADVAYVPTTPAPTALALIPGGPAQPYAAALLLDQSASILQSDATGARLFSAKAFLRGLGADDYALLAAFAGAPGASIPTIPLTVYGPFRDQASAPSYFTTLDSLASLVGGNTPLYDSLDAFQQQLVGDASLPSGLAKAVVLFTDGGDTTCSSQANCRARREQSIQGANANQVRLFTIGLSRNVDVVALGELANRTGGAFLYADSPQQLLPLYGTVGNLLSLSLPTYRLRWTVQAASPGAFQSGDTVLGKVQVTVGSSTFDVPFIVGIP